MEAIAASERAEMLQEVDPATLKTMDWRRLQVNRVVVIDLWVFLSNQVLNYQWKSQVTQQY